MKTAVFSGSFCPVTKGHVDVIQRAAKLVDRLYVVILTNPDKHYAISVDNRLELLVCACSHISNVVCQASNLTMADYCLSVHADFIIKSGRNATDLQYEMDMAQINEELSGIETVFIACDKRFCAVSSTLVRELNSYGKDITPYVPTKLSKKIKELLDASKQN